MFQRNTFSVYFEEELLILSVYKSKELILRYSIFVAFGLYFVIALDYLVVYILFVLIITYLIISLFFIETRIVIDPQNLTISKKFFIGNKHLSTQFYYSYDLPIEISTLYYNNNVDDNAYNYYIYEFFLTSEFRKIKIFTFHDESPVHILIDFLKKHEIFYCSDYIRLKYLGEVESPKDVAYWNSWLKRRKEKSK